jgi:hypothetical protein
MSLNRKNIGLLFCLGLSFFSLLHSCSNFNSSSKTILINRQNYSEQLEGFWLGQCIANWTGLITEMDKIGIPVNGKGEGFYTREDWGKSDQPNLWGSNNYSQTIDFLFAEKDSVWGADDDTDIEYIYQELFYQSPTLDITGEQIREAWLAHINKEEENYLWVSNQRAFDLMQEGVVPPQTSDPSLNPYFEMIDAQLTTEIFGFYAPSQPQVALTLGHLAVRTTAQQNAALIAEFNIIAYSLAAQPTEHTSLKEKTQWIADEARKHLPDSTYPAKMFDLVKKHYQLGLPWETARDALHERFQIRQEEGYDWPTRDESCHGCFAAGINFGASIVSLLYGEGDLKETIKIGVLAGWDSDNPTATWGGMLGFMLGKKGVEAAFGKELSSTFNIHRTRKGFSNNGIDNFENMAQKGVAIVDRVVIQKMKGWVEGPHWIIPIANENELTSQ